LGVGCDGDLGENRVKENHEDFLHDHGNDRWCCRAKQVILGFWVYASVYSHLLLPYDWSLVVPGIEVKTVYLSVDINHAQDHGDCL